MADQVFYFDKNWKSVPQEKAVYFRRRVTDDNDTMVLEQTGVVEGASTEKRGFLVEEMLATYGSEVKALGNGKVGGYVVLFGSAETPDNSPQKDFFSVKTDFGPHKSTMTLYHHALDGTLKDRVLDPEAEIGADDVGVWIRAQLNLREEYERAVYTLATAGKLGWSSGTAAHLVRRTPIETKSGTVHHIDKWPLGLDASLTPTPADTRNCAVALKSVVAPSFESLVAELTPEAIKAACGDVADEDALKMMMGAREAAWDADAAVERVRKWASKDGSGDKEEMDWGKYGRAFLWHDTENAKEFGSYKLPFSDVEDGELVMMPRGVMAATGAHGVSAADIPEADKERVRKRIGKMYAMMREEFDDDTLRPAWEREEGGKSVEVKALTLHEVSDRVAREVRRLVTGKDPEKDRDVPWVTTYVYPAFVVYGREGKFFRRDYVLVDGKVSLGEIETPVAQEWLPTGEVKNTISLPAGLTFEDHTEAVLGTVRGWHSRMAGIRALRAAKAGRVLSAANRERLMTMCQEIEHAAGEMRRMLEETDPGREVKAIRQVLAHHYLRRARLRAAGVSEN